MSDLKICRICLRTEAKVYEYDQYQLKSFYEEILALKVNEPDELPHYFCFECATMLHKFHKFKEKCYFGQKILKEMLWKGPDGILELMKLSRELKSNNEITTTFSATITDGESDYSENYNETNIVTADTLDLNNEINESDTLAIDSFFIQNNIDLNNVEGQNNENQLLTKICNKISDDIELLNVTDGGFVDESILIQDPDVDLNVEEIQGNATTYCELPSETQTLIESGLDFVNTGINPVEIEAVTDNSIVCCEVPQTINETYEEISLKATVSTIDVNIDSTRETESTAVILCQEPGLCQEYKKKGTICVKSHVDDSSNNNIIFSNESNTESEPTAILFSEEPNAEGDLDLSVDNNQSMPILFYEVTPETQEFNQPVYLESKLDLTGNNNDTIVHNSGNTEEEITEIDNLNLLLPTCNETDAGEAIINDDNSDMLPLPLIQNEPSDSPKLETDPCDVEIVKIASKNQLAPNIHSVVPTTSQEYFECDNELDADDIDSVETLSRIRLKSCTKEDPGNKRVKSRRKYPFCKKVKPDPCHKKCHNRCTSRVTEVERTTMHENYWKMDKRKQQEWLLSCIRPKSIRRRQGASNKKNITYNYVLNRGGKDIRVCQQFLMKTLDISQMRIRYAITKLLTLKNLKKDKDKESDDSDSSTDSSEDSSTDSQ